MLGISDRFLGVSTKNSGLSKQDLRINNVSDNQKIMTDLKNEWGSKQVLNMLDSNLNSGRTESYNTNLILQKDINEEYPMINDSYRLKIQERMGRNTKIAPVFSGGDLKDKFLLPIIESDLLRKQKKKFEQSFDLTGQLPQNSSR